jgi:predicted dithiol-disulfide oxidoreductase (DUF899 family)
VDVFGGKSQLIVYNHMWFPGEQWSGSEDVAALYGPDP